MDWLKVLGQVGGFAGLGYLLEKLVRIGVGGVQRFIWVPSLAVWYDPGQTRKVINTPIRQEMRPARWYHLQVRNTGRGTALGCTGTMVNIEVRRNGEWEQHKNFDYPIPLFWAHTGEEERDIDVRESSPWDRLDLFFVELGQSLIQLHTPLAGRGIQTNFRVKQTYRFTVSVEDSEGRTSAEAQVTVDPARDADGELKETPIEVSGHPRC